MELYKLYQLIHHRTDWYRIYRKQRQMIMPEWYEEQERKTAITFQKLALSNLVISSLSKSF